MGDFIIAAILVIAVVIAIGPIKKHLKGQSGCCGGGSYKSKKKKLEQVIEKKIHIEGMHCENCSNRVMGKINDIPGVSAEVKLKKNVAIVSYAKKVDDNVIIEKIEQAGYRVKQ